MREKLKKVISVIVVVMMVFQLLPATQMSVFAEPDTDYIVRFAYQMERYDMPGGEIGGLYDILDALRITGTVTDAVINSSPGDINLLQIDDTWAVRSIGPFSYTCTLTVTIDGTDQYEIDVYVPSGYDIWVGGIEITPNNRDDVLGDGTGSVKYNPLTKTLTLNNPNITGLDEHNAQIFANFTDLTVNGDAELTYPGAEYGIWVYAGILKITGGTIRAEGGVYGLFTCWDDIRITGGEITAVGGDVEVQTVNGAIVASAGNIIIEGGNVTATGHWNGIVAYKGADKVGSIKITGGTVDATGNSGVGIWSANDAVMISGENTVVYATGTQSAITGGASLGIVSPLRIVTPTDGVFKGGKVYQSDNTTVATTAVIKRVFTVTFDANGYGTAPEKQTVVNGGTASEPQDPDADGATFDGWYKEAACENKYDFSATVTDDITLYAKWLADSQVVFDVQGNGTAPETQQVKYGNTAAEPTEPTAEGYTFDGWYTEAGCTTEYDFSTPVTADITLYAKWLADAKVTFDVQGHGTAPETQQIAYGGTATEPADPAEEGYTFAGWYTDAECTSKYNFSAAVTEDITLYAKWLINVKGFKLHADGTETDGNFYFLKTDELEPVFEKETENVKIDAQELCTDSACSDPLMTEPEKGTTYYFTVCMEDQSYSDTGVQLLMLLPEIADNIDATAEDATIEVMEVIVGSGGYTMLAYMKYTETVIEYTVSNGGESAWTKGSSTGLDYTVSRNVSDDKTYSLFESIEVDGKALAAPDYTAAQGSLKATLLPEYLEKLSAGDHTVKFNFQDGSAETKLTVNDAPEEQKTVDSPKTGDPQNPVAWLGAMLVSAVCLGSIVIFRKKYHI